MGRTAAIANTPVGADQSDHLRIMSTDLTSLVRSKARCQGAEIDPGIGRRLLIRKDGKPAFAQEFDQWNDRVRVRRNIGERSIIDISAPFESRRRRVDGLNMCVQSTHKLLGLKGS